MISNIQNMSAGSPVSPKIKVIPPESPLLRTRDERLDALKILAGQMAHDFNNFLAPVLGYVSLIKEEAQENARVTQYAVALESAARRMEGSLDGMLMAVRPQRRFRPKYIDLDRLAETFLNDWVSSLPHTSRISLRKHIEPCHLYLDQDQWQFVLQHLMANARFALATGGILTVTLRRHTLSDQEAAQLGLANTETACLVVQDNGFGMPPATLARIFDPFYTTRSKTQALGLGLTVVHSVTRLHGGQVIVESSEESGTTVKIWIPFPTFESAAEPAAVVPAIEVPAKKSAAPTILVVDDDPMVIEVVRAFLQRAQFEVLTARNGAEGLKTYQKYSNTISLILSDITMPEMDGVEMVQKIRVFAPTARIIMMSGDVDATRDQKMSLLAPSAPPMIKKPFTLKSLMEILQTEFNK